MDESMLLPLLVDLHRCGKRQGPGGDNETRRALELTRIAPESDIEVADIGCGSGASSLVLADRLKNARITAVDLFPEFLEILSRRAEEAECSSRIATLQASMDDLPFKDESLDLIWSEGAIYNMSFSNGVQAWKRFLRPGGLLAVSEITWLRPDPAEDVKLYWEREYPEIGTATEKISILERAGYDLQGYFVLPPECWIDNYYRPTASRFDDFLERHTDQPEAAQLVEMEHQEADMYQRYQNEYSYGFYVARKR